MTRSIELGWLATCAALIVAALLLARPIGPLAAARRCGALLRAGGRR
jgi:hypothetical protein